MAANVLPANRAPPNPLTGIEGPLRGRGKRKDKGSKGGEKERKERIGRKAPLPLK